MIDEHAFETDPSPSGAAGKGDCEARGRRWPVNTRILTPLSHARSSGNVGKPDQAEGGAGRFRLTIAGLNLPGDGRSPMIATLAFRRRTGPRDDEAERALGLIREYICNESSSAASLELTAQLLESAGIRSSGGIGLLQVASSPRCLLDVRLEGALFHVRVDVDGPALKAAPNV